MWRNVYAPVCAPETDARTALALFAVVGCVVGLGAHAAPRRPEPGVCCSSPVPGKGVHGVRRPGSPGVPFQSACGAGRVRVHMLVGVAADDAARGVRTGWSAVGAADISRAAGVCAVHRPIVRGRTSCGAGDQVIMVALPPHRRALQRQDNYHAQ